MMTGVNNPIGDPRDLPRGGGLIPDSRLRGSAAGWGCIFTTGLTIMGLPFYNSY